MNIIERVYIILSLFLIIIIGMITDMIDTICFVIVFVTICTALYAAIIDTIKWKSINKKKKKSGD